MDRNNLKKKLKKLGGILIIIIGLLSGLLSLWYFIFPERYPSESADFLEYRGDVDITPSGHLHSKNSSLLIFLLKNREKGIVFLNLNLKRQLFFDIGFFDPPDDITEFSIAFYEKDFEASVLETISELGVPGDSWEFIFELPDKKDFNLYRLSINYCRYDDSYIVNGFFTIHWFYAFSGIKTLKVVPAQPEHDKAELNMLKDRKEHC